MIKQGESLFIPFLNGVGVRDAHQKARTYKSIDACRKALKRDFDKVDIVEYAPVRKGYWIRQDDTYTRFMCSVCELKNYPIKYSYCPNCGARMDEKEEENAYTST